MKKRNYYILIPLLLLAFSVNAFAGSARRFGADDPPINLLKNTQWIFTSNADTNRGKCTLTYDGGTDVGGGDTPDPGDVATGATSGATGKVISVTVATGTWAGDDATGTIELGACAGRFQDNESVTFTDLEACTVNQPNSAPGPDKLQNGDFSVDTDPPPGWSAGSSATLTTEAAGKVGNCLMIAENGGASPNAQQNITVVAGKTYYLNGYVKAGTEATYSVAVYDVSNSAWIYQSGSLEETAVDWSTSIVRYFTAPAGCTSARIYLYQINAGAGTTLYFDEVSCYEVAPGCTAADALCFDGIWKDTTLDMYQYYDGTTDGSLYAAMSVPTAQNDFFAWPQEYSQQHFYVRQQGRILTMAGYVKSSTASDVKAFIYDGAYTYSSAHSGGGAQEWLEVTDTISSTATNVHYGFIHTSATPGIAYVSQPMLCYGSSIGAGNYVPEADKWVYLEKGITSQTFHGKTGANGFSDATNSAITLVSDTGGLIGHGCRSFEIAMSCNDVASAGTACYMSIGPVASTTRVHDFWVQPYGLPNDGVRYGHGRVTCGTAGTYYYTIDATGGSTFDIPTYRYTAAEWR